MAIMQLRKWSGDLKNRVGWGVTLKGQTQGYQDFEALYLVMEGRMLLLNIPMAPSQYHTLKPRKGALVMPHVTIKQ